MTAPALVIPTLPPGVPTWSVDNLTVYGSYTLDELGREWGIEGGTDGGWAAPAAPRTKRDDRPFADGVFRSPAFRQGRQFSLGGYVGCPDPGLRELAEAELAGLCSDGGRLYEFRRRTDRFDQVAMVELDGQPLIEMVNLYTVRWQFTFFAPDPRKHDWLWQQPICSPPQPTAGGLAFPLNFGNTGLDFGTPSSDSTVAQVGNYGTAPAYPLFRLEGPLSTPTVLHRETGRALRYTTDLAAGEELYINCDGFAQRDVPAHAAVSSQRGNVATLLVREGPGWPVVDPQAVATFALRSYGQAGASLRVGLRSAWW